MEKTGFAERRSRRPVDAQQLNQKISNGLKAPHRQGSGTLGTVSQRNDRLKVVNEIRSW